MSHDASAARALHIADQALGALRRGELDRARSLRAAPTTDRGWIAPETILFVSNDFTTLAGSQIYATRWMDDLRRRGLPVEQSDVLSLFARDPREAARDTGAIVTWGDSSAHVIRRFFGFSPSPPLVALTGNAADCRTDPGWLADLVVCSTEHAAHRAFNTVVGAADDADRPVMPAVESMLSACIVLHPPIAPIYFETPIPPLSERRAVVQINLSKRPEIFDALARAMPDVPFIAVRGYGEQRIPSLPNVTVLPQAAESPMEAYRQARVLIQPGIESYGLAAAEAGAMEVTVVAHDCPGAVETMATAFVSGDQGWPLLVREALSDAVAGAAGARRLLRERQQHELDDAADALARLMGR